MKRFQVLLYFLFLSGVTLSLYPLLELFQTMSHIAAWITPVLTGILLFCTWIGMTGILVGYRFYAKHTNIWRVFAGLFLLILVAAGAVLAPYSILATRVIYGFLAAFCCFGGMRLVFVPLENLVQPYVFVGLCIWNCLLGWVLWLSSKTIPIIPMLGILAGNAILFALVHNRNAMERMLSGRDGDTWELPQEIRRSNRKWMCWLLGIGLLLLLCSKPLSMVLHRIWRWVYTGVWYGLRWLLSLGGEADVSEAVENVPETVIPLEQRTNSEWVQLVVELGILAILLGLVIWKRHAIGEAMQNMWYQLRHWLREHFARGSRQKIDATTSAYCDYVEDLLTHTNAQTVELRRAFRSWKQAYRRYRRMPKGAERFRLGYALALEKLPEDLQKPSDSPQEILERLYAAYPDREIFLKQWSCITAAYSDVRYGAIMPDEPAFAAMEEILREF